MALVIILALVIAVGFQAYAIWKTGRFPSSGLMVFIVLIGVPAIRVLYHTRKNEHAKRGTAQLFITVEGTSIRRGPGDAPVIPWNRFNSLRFRRLRYHNAGRDTWHLRLSVPFWQFSLQHDVQVIIECTPRQAALVRSEIRQRWRAARAAAGRESNGSS